MKYYGTDEMREKIYYADKIFSNFASLDVNILNELFLEKLNSIV